MLLITLLSACGSVMPSAPEPGVSPEPAETAEAPRLVGLADTPAPEAAAAPSPVPDVSAEEETGFSVVWISDTQHYSELHPDMLRGMMAWAAEKRAEENIQLLVHTGDMINRPGSARQWTAATEALDALDGIPFLALAGNHDVGTQTLDYGPFLEHIASRYPDVSAFFAGGRGAFALLGTEEYGFLFIGTGYGYSDESVAWLRETIQRYPLYTAVLCVHSYLNSNGSLTDGGEILYEEVVKKCPTVRLVLCGHRDGVAFLQHDFDYNNDGLADRQVHVMLYNYQEDGTDGGGGYMRILRFDTGSRSVAVETYSPMLDAYRSGEGERFVIENAF
ncbi:MAG: metallophosphoesterase [Clostridia bacterium]|nr:metallophosphoesterase [Clostridia bacterium]